MLPKKEYRADIDGLRAIAVLSVVIYHAGFSRFSGGYVGVDIFFVISGYLITQLLVLEISKNGTINFLNFYLRRARRLLPALLFTFVVTTALAVWYLTPQRLQSYGASLIHSLLSVSNIYFYSENGYFDTNSSLKPLLHTWSLGVEEQFYLIWPLMLFLAAPRKFLGPIFISITGFISLYLARIFIDAHSAAVFFLTPFRVFEFSLGAILLWLPRNPKKYIFGLDILLMIGLGLIIFSVSTYTENTKFPGLNALAPCIGAALCIYAGADSYCGKILKNKILVGVGLISYSFYLVHWPIIVFYKYHTFKEKFTLIDSSILVVTSLLIAAFMYFFVEKPYRKVKNSNTSFLLTVTLLTFFICYIAASMWGTSGWGWRSWATNNNLSIQNIKKGKDLRFQTSRIICAQKGWEKCDEPVENAVNALVIGDSFAVDALNAFYKIFPTHNFSISELGGCPPYQNIEKLVPPSHPDFLKCKNLNIKRYDPEYLKKFDYIVINIFFQWYTPDHLKEYLQFLSANNIKKVIVLGSYFSLDEEMPDLINKIGFNYSALNQHTVFSAENESKLKIYSKEYGYYFLSKRNTFCANELCELFDANKTPFTYDKFHLAYEFSTRMAIEDKSKIERFLGNIVTIDKNL